jgi:RND family efflux transporter MFP subunit
MFAMNFSQSPKYLNRVITLIIAICVMVFIISAAAQAQIDGFTEPFRSIELSSDESGAISTLEIREGQFVDKDQVIARLDNRVQTLQLEIATHLANSNSQLVAAQKSFEKRKTINDRLMTLKARGHASESEIIRADMELSIAEAKLMATQEEVAVREIEMRRAKAELERRTIVAPFSGLVSKIHRREGEFLSPLRPEIATIIKVDKLLANFAISSSQISQFEPGAEFELQFESGRVVTARVYSVGVQTDAQSGTVEVKLVFDNPNGEFRAGEICSLNI